MLPLEGLMEGFLVVLSPGTLFFCFIGVLIGTLVGVLPGLGPTGAMALLLPITFRQDVSTAMIMLCGIYYGAMYGGSTTSILVNVPGEAASVVTCIDGHQMAKKGRAGPALTICAIGSFVAGTIGVFFLMLLAPPLARVALKFGPPEYFAIAFLGLLVLSQMTGRSPLKSYCMMFSGMIIATIGIDPMSGYPRFTLGSSKLLEGIGFMPVIMGLYGVGEVLSSLKDIGISLKAKSIKLKELIPSSVEVKESAAPIVRGGIIGFLMGLIPGPANIISTFVSYGLERKISKNPDEFGKGAIAGFAGPESANNGATAGALVPLLSLGIPFSPLPAVLLAGFMIHGVLPGPLLIQNHPTVFWGIIASMYIGNIMLVILNLPLVGIFAQVALIPARILMPLVLVFCFLGAFSFRNSVFDLYILVAFGLIGYFLRRKHFDPSPLVLGIIIGPMIEYSFRQSVIMFGGNYMSFFNRPLSGSILIITILVFIYPILTKIFKYYVKQKKLVKRQN